MSRLPEQISPNGSPVKTASDWRRKAKSRLWSIPSIDLSKAPLWALVVGTFLGVGFFPIASGTFASGIAAGIILILGPMQTAPLILGLSFVMLVIGIAASTKIEDAYHLDDPSIIVADEVVGQWIALVPWFGPLTLTHALIGFIAFRFFDIVKVWPASILERRKGGVGVMMDDVIAGLYANIVTTLIVKYLI